VAHCESLAEFLQTTDRTVTDELAGYSPADAMALGDVPLGFAYFGTGDNQTSLDNHDTVSVASRFVGLPNLPGGHS
jgi:hypothetical protein